MSLQDCRAKVSSSQRFSVLNLHTQSDTLLSCKQLLANSRLVDVYITTFWLLQPVLGLNEWLYEWWKLQNRVARVITKSPFDTSCNLLLAILKWEKLSLRRKEQKASIMYTYKTLNELALDYLQCLFAQRHVNDYSLRNLEGKLSLPKPNTNYLQQRAFVIAGPVCGITCSKI